MSGEKFPNAWLNNVLANFELPSLGMLAFVDGVATV